LADTADEKVYEYNLENLWDNKAAGRPIEGSLYEMFNSYAELFEQIVALKVEHNDSDDVDIIEAQ